MANQSEKRQAGTEVEVSPAMAEAGLVVLGSFNPEWDSGLELVAKIYRAMHAERRDTSTGIPKDRARDRSQP